MDEKKKSPRAPNPAAIGYSYQEARELTSLGPTSLHALVNAGVIRVAHVGVRAILNGEDVRRVATEGHDPQPRIPPVRRGDEHHRRPRRRRMGGEPPEVA